MAADYIRTKIPGVFCSISWLSLQEHVRRRETAAPTMASVEPTAAAQQGHVPTNKLIVVASSGS